MEKINRETYTRKSVCSKDCPGACGLLLHCQDGQLLKVTGDSENVASKGLLCAKGRNYPEYLREEKRLLSPLRKLKKDGAHIFEPISWEEAYALITDKLIECRELYGTESVLHYQGAGDFGILSFNYPKGFWRQYGPVTNVTGDLCDIAGGTAIRYTYGAMKHNYREDLENARLIILWGKNPKFTDIHTMRYINQAVTSGAKLVVIDPRRNESAANASMHIAPRCGTDGLLALGVAKILKDRGVLDYAFLGKHVRGAEAYLSYLDTLPMEEIVRITEVSLEEIRSLADCIEATPHYALVCGSGLQRYPNGGQTVRAIACLPALTGSIGKSGAGLYYSENQSNSIKWPYTVPDCGESGREIAVAHLASEIASLDSPEIHFAWIEKANPLISNPNCGLLREELKKIDFKVVVDLFMSGTAMEADLVLPAASLFEKSDLLSGYGTAYLQMQEQVLEPMGESKDECLIYRELAERMGMDPTYLPEDFRQMVEGIIKYNGLNTSYEKMKESPYWHEPYERIAYEDLVFDTPSGKIEVYCEKLCQDWQVSPLPEFKELMERGARRDADYPLQLLSYHARNRLNSQEMVEAKEEERLRIHPDDAYSRNLSDGDIAVVENKLGSVSFPVSLCQSMRKGMVAIAFGESGRRDGRINVLVEDAITDLGLGTAFHDTWVEVRKLLY